LNALVLAGADAVVGVAADAGGVAAGAITVASGMGGLPVVDDGEHFFAHADELGL
jgi:carbamate kinase